MRGPDYDVICIGAGPAGGLASYLLAKHGLSVLLIEKSPWPRAKVCGGGLTARALVCLPFAIDSVIERRIGHVRLAFGQCGNVEVTGESLGVTVVRSAFDSLIADKAVEAGVCMQVATAVHTCELGPNGVSVVTSRGNRRARLLIGADGARSSVRRCLFPRHQPSFAFGLETDFRPALPAGGISLNAESRVVLDFACANGGYGWVFPRRNHFNVGIYRLNKPKRPGGMRSALARFASTIPELADCTPDPAVGHPIPICSGRQPVGRGRAILIGDAAGLTEAFFGEGISFALESARIAADWASAWLNQERGDPARSFRSALQPFVNDLRWSRAVAHARYRLPVSWMARAIGAPAIRDATLDLLAGRASYRKSFWQMPLLLPKALLQTSALMPAEVAAQDAALGPQRLQSQTTK